MGNLISVIIVEYNTPERTAAYVRDLSVSSDTDDLSFVIVDNYTKVDNESRLQQFLRKNGGSNVPLRYVHADKNLGYAAGNNLGAAKANEHFDPEYYLFSNSDIQLSKPFELNTLLKVLQDDPQVAVVGPRIVGPDGVTQSPSVCAGIVGKHIVSNLLWPVNLFIPSIHRLNRNVLDHPVTGPVDYVMGSFMLVKRSAFEEAGGFDEHTFLYAEEPILAERLLRKGYIEYYVNEVSLIHEEGGSTTDRSVSDMANLLKKRKRVFASEMYYYKQYRNTPEWLISIAWISFYCFCLKLRFYMLLKRLISGNLKRKV